MAEKKLSDEEILKIIEEFEALGPYDKKYREIGKGGSKIVYDVPNTDYVMKKVRRFGEPADVYDTNELIDDYLSTKKLDKTLPIEKPMLVTFPKADSPAGHEAYHLQKKLKPINTFDYPDEVINKTQEISQNAKQKYKNLDLPPHNFGLDEKDNLRILDYYDGSPEFSPKIMQSKKTALQKIISNASKKPQILRQLPLIGPAIGAGLAAMSGEANAASGLPILGEADNLGPEQGSEDWEIENPQRNPAARRAALEKLSR